MGRGLAHGHTEVRGRPRTGAQAFSLPLHTPPFVPAWKAEISSIISALPSSCGDLGNNGQKNSMLTGTVPLSWCSHCPHTQLGQAPDPHSCSRSPRGLSPAQVQAVPSHAACPNLWATVKPRGWTPPELELSSTLVPNRNLRERGEEQRTPTC